MGSFKLLVAVVVVYIFLVGMAIFVHSPSVDLPKDELWVVLYADDRYWRVNCDGTIVDVASKGDLAESAVVQDVRLDGLRVSEDDLEKLRYVEDVLRDPHTAVLSVGNRYVITVKGVVLYFKRWEDLKKYYGKFIEHLDYIAPRARLFLLEGGKLVILRGD